jgi:hypothetical protein
VPIGVQRGWESSFLEAVFIILPGFATLQKSRTPSGEFNRRFCQATTQAHTVVSIVSAWRQIRHPPGTGQFLQVMSDPPENPDHTTLIHGNIIGLWIVIFRSEIYRRRLLGGE